MKTISLTQPWATLVALGCKQVETRSWAVQYRGWIAIHSALNMPGWARTLCQTEPFQAVLWEHLGEAFRAESLPFGKVIAVARLVDCVPTRKILCDERCRTLLSDAQDCVKDDAGFYHISPQEWAFGDYSEGRFAWIFDEVKRLPEPISAKGSLSLWDCDAPELVKFMAGQTFVPTAAHR